MFEHLGRYRNVIVTGAHRAGTTIAARIIAEDTGKRFEIERNLARPRFEGDDEPDLQESWVARWLDEEPDTVLQGATCFRWLPGLDREDLGIVFVWRDPEDVRASQMRYRGRVLDSPADKLRQFTAMQLLHPEVIQYEDLEAHPLFHADRTGWRPRQIAPDDRDLRDQ